MPRQRTRRHDHAEPRSPTNHWGLFALLGQVRRALEEKHNQPRPHAPAEAEAAKGEDTTSS